MTLLSAIEFCQVQMPYLTTLAKEKLISWGRPVTHIHSKIERVLPCPRHQVHENLFGTFCANLPKVKQTFCT